MTTITLNLDERSRLLIDSWVREGHYASVEEVVEAGIAFVHEQVATIDWEPKAEDVAAVEAGRASFARGEGIPLEVAFTALRARFPGR